MTVNRQPKITLIGAGPGDPDLITVKGLKALQSAQVVLYDALANVALLDEVAPGTILINVGKRAGNHRYSQEQINQMLVGYALAFGTVVRLKGGDPFVFGRGYEEMAYAESFDIQTEIIPGISSSIAVPAMQKVPVTSRGYSQSFWVLTATTRSGQLSKDLALAAQSNATVIILMGMRKLPAIVDLFKRHGKAATPAMVIQNGSLPEERYVCSPLDQLAEQTAEAGLGSPGIIVIGEVAGLHADYVLEAVKNKIVA